MPQSILKYKLRCVFCRTVTDGKKVFELDGVWPWTIKKLKDEVKYDNINPIYHVSVDDQHFGRIFHSIST